jgi:superfamily II DNA/RNA helicase
MEKEQQTETKSFESLGVNRALVNALSVVGIKKPTLIQSECIPSALKGENIIGHA